MNIQELITSWAHLKDLKWKVNTDRFKYVAASEGISESKAMKMYQHFQTFTEGSIPYPDHKAATAEYLQQIIDLAERAKAEYEVDLYTDADLTNFDYHNWGDEYKYALYIFSNDKGEKTVEEFNIAHPDTYISVALLLKGGWRLKHIIRQCDETSNTERYQNFTKEERGRTLRIYDGDVFEVVPAGSITANPADCGMYLCHNGAYRKLIYIPGKGYVNGDEPLVDKTVEINIDSEGLFNSYKLTWDGFRKVGNIHVDMGCLVEKK